MKENATTKHSVATSKSAFMVKNPKTGKNLVFGCSRALASELFLREQESPKSAIRSSISD